MLKSTLAAASVLGLAVFPAQAETVRFETTITYDKALLLSDEGLVELRNSIRSQARDACRFSAATSFASSKYAFDHECAKKLTQDAMAILEDRENVDFADLKPADAPPLFAFFRDQSEQISLTDY